MAIEETRRTFVKKDRSGFRVGRRLVFELEPARHGGQ